jgi:PTS system mannose-specific IIA component
LLSFPSPSSGHAMIGIVLVTHGRLAQEIIAAMEHMVGPQPQLRAVCIGPEDDVERRQREIGAAAKSVDAGSGTVIVTDMYGGTPCNLALTLLQRGKIEVLAGANLPSLIKLVDIRAKLPLEQAVKEAIDAGRKYMRAGSADLGGGS